MRIAYISADLGVPIFGRKGCSIHAQEVLRALLARGALVDLFTCNAEGERPRDLEAIRLNRLPRPPKGERAAREQAALALNEPLRQQLEREGPFDLVYERYSLWTYAGMEFARSAGVPGLLEVNAPLIEEQALYRELVDRAGAELAADRAFRAATALLAVSDELAAYLGRFASTCSKVHVVPNAINPERFPALAQPALPARQGMFTVGFAGTLKAWHGLSFLAEAFGLLHARHPQTRLLIVGDGPERETLSAGLAARGLSEAAHFTGVVPPVDVPAFLASMNAAVAPYPGLAHFYFSPLKVFEYMAAGLPVVASRIGQLETLIVPGVTGLLVPPGDPVALADALELLLADAGLRDRLGRAARAAVLRDHTWDKVAERILGLAELDPASGPGQTAVTVAQTNP
jgi:glycosyltransferase involved in cell wall biosynthesis